MPLNLKELGASIKNASKLFYVFSYLSKRLTVSIMYFFSSLMRSDDQRHLSNISMIVLKKFILVHILRVIPKLPGWIWH
jgi:hypothetical protein